ncbi:glutathione S-transferase family protein [Gloeocapsa sp. BRSZ]
MSDRKHYDYLIVPLTTDLIMSTFTLVIGNKNYSSWSLRPWLVLKQIGINFTEIRIPLYTPAARQELLRHSPAGKVPILHHGDITVWESLAICEYLAEFPDTHLLPKEPLARALARSISAEMHASFYKLRYSMPMNCRARLPGLGMQPGVQEDIDRVLAIWNNCRNNFGSSGDMLFSHFTIPDAMFAPVVLRFMTYGVKLDSTSQAYAEAILALPAIQEWIAAAQNEPESIPEFELSGK